MSGILLLLCGYYGNTKAVSVTLITLEIGISSAVSSAGYFPNMMDLSPNYAGILMGVSNTIGTLPGMIAPLVAGAIVHKVRWRDESIIVYM